MGVLLEDPSEGCGVPVEEVPLLSREEELLEILQEKKYWLESVKALFPSNLALIQKAEEEVSEAQKALEELK